MAESLNSVYAQAMFELCCEQNCCKEAFEEISLTAQIFDENDELVKLLKSPLIDISDKKSVLADIFGGRLSDVVFDFLCLITEKGRAGYFCGISQAFKELYYEKNNILEVQVITAQTLSERLRDKLKVKLEQIMKKNIIICESVDSSLIGGIILRYNNSEIDSSVRGRLDRLKEQIDSIIA